MKMKIPSINLFNFLIAYIYLWGIKVITVKADDCLYLEKAINYFGNDLKEKYDNIRNNLKSCCEFQGVICQDINNEKHITEIKFNFYKSFSKKESEAFNELSNLQHLTSLDMDFFMFSSGFPAEIGKLKNLKTLHLSHNSFVSNIPEEIGNLINLVDLKLSFNYLTGTIPKSFSNLKKLKYLSLENNRLEGTVPYDFKYLEDMQDLRLNDNFSLHGYIPLFPLISNCNYAVTNLCILKSAKCKAGLEVCSLEDIHMTNKENGNPNPLSVEYDNECKTNNFIKSPIGIIIIIIAIILILILLILICLRIKKNGKKEHKIYLMMNGKSQKN